MSANAVESKETKDTDTAKSLILTNPVASTVSRRRTYALAQLRVDYRDAQTQLIVLLTQLHTESFTGQLVFNMHDGNVRNIETIQSQKINTDAT